MKIQLLPILAITCYQLYAVTPVIDEAQLLAARSAGNAVFHGCIETPPVTPAQAGVCAGLYGTYVATLTALNAPYPLVSTTSPSPYSWSPYDICRFEPSHFVFPPEGFPICPALPI
jgi:hypothetical protein